MIIYEKKWEINETLILFDLSFFGYFLFLNTLFNARMHPLRKNSNS